MAANFKVKIHKNLRIKRNFTRYQTSSKFLIQINLNFYCKNHLINNKLLIIFYFKMVTILKFHSNSIKKINK